MSTPEYSLFLADAARWVQPEQFADVSEVTPKRLIRLLVNYPSLRAMAWLRVGAFAHRRGVRGVPNLVKRRIQRVYGLEIDPKAPIGGGLYVAHPVGCTLIVESMGSGVSVMGAVTFGRMQDERWPRLGDHVFVGAGARVLGPISVGDGARIGANAVVISDVPAGATAVGVPARVR
ncbi:MAG: serine O-acetyltransferase [Acidimicrobiales bacterium]